MNTAFDKLCQYRDDPTIKCDLSDVTVTHIAWAILMTLLHEKPELDALRGNSAETLCMEISKLGSSAIGLFDARLADYVTGWSPVDADVAEAIHQRNAESEQLRIVTADRDRLHQMTKRYDDCMTAVLNTLTDLFDSPVRLDGQVVLNGVIKQLRETLYPPGPIGDYPLPGPPVTPRADGSIEWRDEKYHGPTVANLDGITKVKLGDVIVHKVEKAAVNPLEGWTAHVEPAEPSPLLSRPADDPNGVTS